MSTRRPDKIPGAAAPDLLRNQQPFQPMASFFSCVMPLFRFLRAIPGFCRRYGEQGLRFGGFWRALRRFCYSSFEHRLDPEEFFRYRVWRQELETDQWTAFIGWRKHIKALSHLNPVPYRCLTENKIIFYQRCLAANIPTPEVYAVLDPARPKAPTIPSLQSVEELLRFIEEKEITEFVMKPVHGTKGQAVRLLHFDPTTGLRSADGTDVSRSDLEALTQYAYRGVEQNSFLIQERVYPHASTQQLNANCPVSYRVITLLDQVGNPHKVHVYVKLPGGESLTDNLAAGGLACPVDENGICVGGRASSDFTQLIARDPSRDLDICGWKAPYYTEVCDLAFRLAIEFHPVRCVAWDVDVSNKGLMVYEGNNPWNMNIQDVNDRGLWQGNFAAQAGAAFRDGPENPPWWS